jgi:Flp pilus assembly protein TadD
MRRAERSKRAVLQTPLALLALLGLGDGCAGTGGRAAPPVEVRDAVGFSIREPARISAAMRSDFDAAHTALVAGDFDRAIALLEPLAAHDAAPTAVSINLGLAYAGQGDLAKAEASFTRALARNPRHPVAGNELALVLRRGGRFDEARHQLEAVLEAHPDFQPARKNLGILCDLYLADPACAVAQYEAYHAAVPADAKVGLWLADLRQRTAAGGAR